jgi:hypothetical protein
MGAPDYTLSLPVQVSFCLRLSLPERGGSLSGSTQNRSRRSVCSRCAFGAVHGGSASMAASQLGYTHLIN